MFALLVSPLLHCCIIFIYCWTWHEYVSLDFLQPINYNVWICTCLGTMIILCGHTTPPPSPNTYALLLSSKLISQTPHRKHCFLSICSNTFCSDWKRNSQTFHAKEMLVLNTIVFSLKYLVIALPTWWQRLPSYTS